MIGTSNPLSKGRTDRFALLALVSGALICFSLLGCRPSSSSVGQPQPPLLQPALTPQIQAAQDLYEEVWQVVLHDYVDPSFNGQEWSRWHHHYDGLLKDPEDAHLAIATMLSSLNDEFTRYLPPRDMNEQTMSIDSKLYGIGVQIAMKDNKLMVVAPLEDTPADKAGLQPLDIITHIEGHTTAGLSVEDAADQIRGKAGTVVRLTLKRKTKSFTVAIPRQEIKLKSVFTKPVPEHPEIGYIQLTTFISEDAMAEMRQALKKMSHKDSLIIDLRGNYGGLLTNAVEISDLFLDKGPIVSMSDRQHESHTYTATAGQAFYKPIVLLINGGSASASEILSGALKDHHRATLIGTKTFGKGVVQKITTLSDGSGMNITISKYFTPNGTDIDKKGIQPDVAVPFTDAHFFSNKDPQLEAAVQYLKAPHQVLSHR